MDTFTESLCKFLDESHSAYHAQAALRRELEAAGYVQLAEGDAWALAAGGKYFVCRGGAAVIAFRIPEQAPRGFLLAAAHTDRPSLKLKENGETVSAYVSQQVERYGGLLVSPWLDRPLSIAGRALVQTESGAQVRLIDIDRDLMLIPNVAIHMNRQANEGYKWNPAVDTLPLIGGAGAAGKLPALLEKEAGGKILGQDLYLYIRQKATVWGVDEEYISSAALDDLECAWGCTQGFLRGKESGSIPVLCVFDSEEVGSVSPQGAASSLLEDTLTRICDCLRLNRGRMLAQSFLVSADNAHAVHPNHPEYADPNNAPVMGGGPVIKYNANLSYCTDSVSAAVFRKICAGAGVRTQSFHNRADLRGGSTLGGISLGHVSVPTVDIGLAQLAMHSCYETAAVSDAIDLETAMEAYYGASLEATQKGFSIL